jgi:hypothetical protein
MRKLIMLIGLMLGSFLLHAQKYYAVMVLDSKAGEPISGASIKIKSTGKILTTSESGNAVIQALPTDSLQIQFKGYKERQIALADQSQAISIVMVATPKVIASKPKKKRHR